MEGQRQRSGGGRRRRRKARAQARSANPEPVLIAARRPNSPLIAKAAGRGTVAASASPQPERDRPARKPAKKLNGEQQPQRRAARIVALPSGELDADEQERQRLLERLLFAEGRSAISRAARAYAEGGFEFPEDQEVQLRLLEHMDEDVAAQAIDVMTRLLEDDAPIKKPVLEQRLRRLEEYAEDGDVRDAAASLRRAIR